MNKPKISVVISTYNRLKKLKRTVESVQRQSLKDLEIVIVNDCSPDGTEEWVKEIQKKDDRISYYKTEKNTGHDGQPKNIGIMNAKADYVAFLDDDDRWFEDSAKILYKYIQHTGADMVYGDYYITNNGKRALGWSLEFSVQNLTQFNFITVGSTIIKKQKLIEIGGFNELIPRFKDWNVWIRLAKAGCQIIHVPIPVLELDEQAEDSVSVKFGAETEVDENGRYKATWFNPADCKIYADKTIMGERKPLKVAIYTMTLNRAEYTEIMYEAMKKTADYPFDWFVLDQGSTDGSQRYLRDKCTLIEMKENIGIAKGWERLIEEIKKAGGYDIVIKIDNDAQMMTQGWLKEMIEIFESNTNLILSPYVEGLEDNPGGVMRQRPDGQSPYVLINDRVMGMVPNLGGICFASPIRLFDGFRFPEGIQGNRDYYLSHYAKSIGFNLLYMEELRVYHQGGKEGQTANYKL